MAFLFPPGLLRSTEKQGLPSMPHASRPSSSSRCLWSTSVRMRPCKSSLPGTYKHPMGKELKFGISNAIISLNLACLMLTYVVSIACLLYRRVHQPELLPKARWTLGRSGVAINIAALTYSTFALFWSFWPNVSHLSLVDFNWAIVMFLVTLLVAMVDWEFRAKYAYFGPVQKITVAADDERVHSS